MAKAVIFVAAVLLVTALTIPAEEITRNDEPCEHNALQPHLTNCGSFYQCAYGELIELQCPEGLHFSSANDWCDYPDKANCQVAIAPTPTTREPWQISTLPPQTTEQVTDVPSTFSTVTVPTGVVTSAQPPWGNVTQPDWPTSVITPGTVPADDITSAPPAWGNFTIPSSWGNFTIPSSWGNITFPDWLVNITIRPTRPSTNRPHWTTKTPNITTPTPALRDNCQFVYSTQLYSKHQSHFCLNEVVAVIEDVSHEFKVLVRADRDAKIILAHRNDQFVNIPEYEIVLGENNNKRFSINRNGKYVARTNRDKLLSSTSWLPVIVRVYTDGLIELQIEGERNAFLQAKNKNHPRIDFVGFSDIGNTTSDWIFGCPIKRASQRSCRQYSTEANETAFIEFWEVESIEQNLGSDDIKLNVYVQATSDVSILLSSVANNLADSSAPFYEIVLGAGDNEKYELNRNSARLNKDSARNLLKPETRVPVEISIKKNGSIEVKVAGSKGAKLKAKDSNVIDVRFISFRSNNASQTSEWFFDC